MKSYWPKKHYFYLVNKFSQGIVVMITDADTNHRLVAKGLDASKTEASVIMTPNPTWVSMNDATMEINYNNDLNEADDLSVLLSLIVVLKHLASEYLRLRQAPNLLQNFVLQNQLLSLTRLVCLMFANF